MGKCIFFKIQAALGFAGSLWAFSGVTNSTWESYGKRQVRVTASAHQAGKLQFLGSPAYLAAVEAQSRGPDDASSKRWRS